MTGKGRRGNVQRISGRWLWWLFSRDSVQCRYSEWGGGVGLGSRGWFAYCTGLYPVLSTISWSLWQSSGQIELWGIPIGCFLKFSSFHFYIGLPLLGCEAKDKFPHFQYNLAHGWCRYAYQSSRASWYLLVWSQSAGAIVPTAAIHHMTLRREAMLIKPGNT